MVDQAKRGNRLTRRPHPKDIRDDALESVGIISSGGIKGKPHSTKKGRKAAGARTLSRFFYGRGKKEGTKV